MSDGLLAHCSLLKALKIVEEMNIRFNALEERGDVLLFVGRVKVVVGQAEAHDDRIDSQDALDVADYRHAAAFASEHGLDSENFL